MSAISDYQFKEILLPTTAPLTQTGVITLNLPLNLNERRIYFYVEVKQSTGTEFILRSRINLYKAGELVAQFPADIGMINNLLVAQNQGLQCMFNAGGSAVGDCLIYTPSQGFTASTSQAQILQPLRLENIVDTCRLDIVEVVNLNAATTGYRFYLGVLSSTTE